MPEHRLPAISPGWTDLAFGEVHLWWIDAGTLHPNAATLSRGELARSRKFRRERDRTRFVAARTAVREILAGYLGLNAGALRITVSDSGKPCLSHGPGDLANLAFSLSHSGKWAVLAVSRGGEIGVDLEIGDQIPDRDSMFAALTPNERDFALSLDDEALHTAFRVAWTRKEACLKAAGIGFAIDPHEVEAGMAPVPGIIRVPGGSGPNPVPNPLPVHVITPICSHSRTVSLARVGSPVATPREFRFRWPRCHHHQPSRHTIHPSNNLGAFKCAESLQS